VTLDHYSNFEESSEASPAASQNGPQAASLDQPQDKADLPSAAPITFFSKLPTENDDDYGAIVAVLTGKLRVIQGRCGLQWILQSSYGSKGKWKSLAYCGTKEGLILRLKEHLQGRDAVIPLAELAKRCDPIEWKKVEALPDFCRSVSADIRPEADPAAADA
jgi:hypothetical protein